MGGRIGRRRIVRAPIKSFIMADRSPDSPRSLARSYDEVSPQRGRLVAAASALVEARLPYGHVWRDQWDCDEMPPGLDCSSLVCRAVRDAGVEVLLDLAASAVWMHDHLPATGTPRPGDLALFRRPGEQEVGVAADGCLYHVMLVEAPSVLVGTCAESPQGDDEPGGTFRCTIDDHPGEWTFVGFRTLLRD